MNTLWKQASMKMVRMQVASIKRLLCLRQGFQGWRLATYLMLRMHRALTMRWLMKTKGPVRDFAFELLRRTSVSIADQCFEGEATQEAYIEVYDIDTNSMLSNNSFSECRFEYFNWGAD